MPKWLVGIQVGAISFVDEGVEAVLDIFREKAAINAIMLACQTWDRGTGGRQLEGHPLPDHGVQEYDRDFVGGNFATIHPQYYGNTIMREFRAPDKIYEGLDILEAVIPLAKTRGMEVYCWINENPWAPIPRYVPNWPKVLEQDIYGRPAHTPCFNNPDYRNWHLSLIEDYCKSYDVAGIMWASERQGPLGNLLEGWHEVAPSCFCDHCRAQGRERGINVERARQGYRELLDFVTAARQDRRPSDGYFVTFWRLLLKYPEILSWEKLWHDGMQQLCREIYGVAKAIDSDKKVGWHIMHSNSFSPFYRATQDYSEYRHFSDFIKVVAYHNCAGPRFARYMRRLHQTILHDAKPEESLRLMYRILDYEEADLEALPTAGFSADYVRRETERAVRGVDGAIPIYPGIDIDIPTGLQEKRTKPEDTRAAIEAAHRGGAQGVILSRKYSEMQLKNLAAAGEALRHLNLV